MPIFTKSKKSNEGDLWFKKSYSQSGEDLIVKFIFDSLNISHPSYIDIGAHHPYYLSNTAIFYELGCRGMNIEADPNLFTSFQQHRMQDENLNIGISTKKGFADFYIISTPTLNTFSKLDAERYQEEGDYHITDIIKIPTDSINNIIDAYYGGVFPNFLNVDAEGIDELIIRSIDYDKSYPLVICVETLSFSSTGKGIKNTTVTDYLIQKGYMIYADTNINTILVKRKLWERVD